MSTHFASDGSAASHSATTEYGTAPERPGRFKERSSRKEVRNRSTPSSGSITAQFKRSKLHVLLTKINHELFYVNSTLSENFSEMFNHGKSFNSSFILLFMVSTRE